MREALAVTWSCQYFYYYVFDSAFTVTTDNKPFETLLSPKSNTPPRIQESMLQLQGYNGNAKYVPRANNPAGYISRNPLTTIHADNPADHYIKHLIDYALLKSISLANIIQHFKQDPITQKKKKKNSVHQN